MTVNTTEINAFSVNNIATGQIRAFGKNSTVYCDFNYTYTYSGGSLNGQKVRVHSRNTSLPGLRVADGVKFLPGGRVFSPWSLAGERAPVFYPTWTQTIVYSGNIEPVLREYSKLLSLTGTTSDLFVSFGRRTDGTYAYKICKALLMPVNGIVERVAETGQHPATTWVEITATWQQVDNFQYAYT